LRRKVIQIAGSTQLVSLPRQWAKRNNLQKGQEIEVRENGNTIVVMANAEPFIEKAEIDISKLDVMIPRCISALYKRGVDSLRVTYSDPTSLSILHKALAKDTVGFEILEQGENTCMIKHVAGETTEFNSVLRRVFLLLNTMSEESISAFRKENYTLLGNLAFLEEANNRFTTICMRYLNTKGAADTFNKVGPLYHMVESLEQLADHYKYLLQHFSKLDKEKVKIRKEVLQLFEKSNKLIRLYSELFYKFDSERVVVFKKERNAVVETVHGLLKRKLNYAENWLVYHSIAITQKVFEMVDALLVLKL